MVLLSCLCILDSIFINLVDYVFGYLWICVCGVFVSWCLFDHHGPVHVFVYLCIDVCCVVLLLCLCILGSIFMNLVDFVFGYLWMCVFVVIVSWCLFVHLGSVAILPVHAFVCLCIDVCCVVPLSFLCVLGSKFMNLFDCVICYLWMCFLLL